MVAHLESRRQERRADPVDIHGGDLDAHVPMVHLERAEGSLPGADVALPCERRHGDGVPQFRQRHVVTESSIHVELRDSERHSHLRQVKEVAFTQQVKKLRFTCMKLVPIVLTSSCP